MKVRSSAQVPREPLELLRGCGLCPRLTIFWESGLGLTGATSPAASTPLLPAIGIGWRGIQKPCSPGCRQDGLGSGLYAPDLPGSGFAPLWPFLHPLLPYGTPRSPSVITHLLGRPTAALLLEAPT